MQPNFFVEPIDTDSTVGVPHDSLDGYFFEFALNLQTMQYLRTTNGLDLDVQVRMMEILKTCKLVLLSRWFVCHAHNLKTIH